MVPETDATEMAWVIILRLGGCHLDSSYSEVPGSRWVRVAALATIISTECDFPPAAVGQQHGLVLRPQPPHIYPVQDVDGDKWSLDSSSSIRHVESLRAR